MLRLPLVARRNPMNRTLTGPVLAALVALPPAPIYTDHKNQHGKACELCVSPGGHVATKSLS